MQGGPYGASNTQPSTKAVREKTLSPFDFSLRESSVFLYFPPIKVQRTKDFFRIPYEEKKFLWSHANNL